MGLFDWIGPMSLTKRRGWDALPAVPERKRADSWTITDYRAGMTVNTLISGPGARELTGGHRMGAANSAVYACLSAICSAYVEAPLYAYLQTGPQDREPLTDSPLQSFLDMPNPELDILEILWWVQWAKHLDGNAYLHKVRAGNELTGNVVQLWPISPSRVEPRTERGSENLIDYYRYYDRPGHYVDIAPQNMVHFRIGLDDRDHRLGLSPLMRLMREVSSDDGATRFADALLQNYAVPGLVVETPPDSRLTPEDAEELKRRVGAAYSGDNAGRVGVLTGGSKMHQLGWSPEQLDLKALHRVPEERIAAVLRVPAIVAGLGAGLERSTFANYAEAREAFTEGTVLPLYRADDRKLTHSLARDFTSDRRVVVAHDTSQMRALQDDENAKATRLQTYVAAGILDVDEARAEIGREPRAVDPAVAAPGGAPPATRSRAPLMVLRSRKALDDLPGQFDNLKDGAAGDWEAALTEFLAQQLRRATRALRNGADNAEALVAEGEAVLLGELLTPRQLALFEQVRGLVIAELGIEFEVDDALTREYLRSAGSQITNITETTRAAVRAALAEGQAAAEGIPQLAARLRELPAFGSSRAVTVARTELGMATQAAALSNYRASGVVLGIIVWDGDYDAECAAMNGRKFPLNAPPALLAHPRCRRAFSPIVDPAEMQGVA